MKIIVKLLSFTFLLGLILYVGVCFYVDSHKKDIIREIEAVFSENCNGTLKIGNASLSSWTQFPSASFSAKNINIANTSALSNKQEAIKIGAVSFKISIIDLLEKKFQVKSLNLSDIEVELITQEGNITSSSLIKDNPEKQENKSQFLLEKKTKINLKNIKLIMQDFQKNKSYHILVNSINGTIAINQNSIKADIALDAIIPELAFNTNSGSFFNGAKLQGNISPEINFGKNRITIPTFNLGIDEQEFAVTTEIDTKKGEFLFVLENDRTDYDASRKLLPESIQKKLADYTIENSIYTHTTLKGSFAKGSNPLVHIQFETDNNKAVIKNDIQLDALSFEGAFKNRIYDDDKADRLDKGNIKLSFSEMTGVYKDVNFSLNNAVLKSTAKVKTYIELELNSKGNAAQLNTIFNSDSFFFRKGTFNISAKIKGDATYPETLLNSSAIKFQVDNSYVVYGQEVSKIPIKTLALDIQNNKAVINSLKVPFNSGDEIEFYGAIDNFTSLFTSNKKNTIRSNIHVKANELRWNDFLVFFHKKNSAATNESSLPTNDLKQTINAIHSKFNPRLNLSIDKFFYDNLVLNNLKAELFFKKKGELTLEEVVFNINENGELNLSGELDTTQENETNIAIELNANGKSDQLNTIFNNDKFLLKGGRYYIRTKFNGEISQIDELIASSTAILQLNNTSILYQPTDVAIPIKAIELDILSDNANLKTLKIVLPSGDFIDFSGEVVNMTSLLFEERKKEEKVVSSFHMHSPKLAFKEVINLFDLFHATSEEEESKPKNGIKDILKDIYSDYNPKLNMVVDEFKFKNMIVQDFKTNLYFENRDSLYLEQADFKFHEKPIKLDAHIDISDSHNTLFSVNFNTDRLSFSELLHSFDYFDIETLKQTEELDGAITLDGHVQGKASDDDGLIGQTLNGKLAFNIEDLKLKGFEPLVSVASKIFRKKRFENIRFNTIEDVIYIDNNVVEIPQLEIQSTAFDFFVEGHLGFEDKDTNVWVSIPLANLKHRDITNVPDKKGAIDAGRKIYIEATREGADKLKYKLHLTNKKLFEQKHILNQYRVKHREEIRLRRQHRREARKEGRQD